MVLFNGVALESVAPIKVQDIVVSPIAQKVTTIDRATQPGAYFVRVRGTTRTVTISFAVITQVRPTRERHIQAVRRWAESDKPGLLLLPDRVGQYLSAVCTAYPQSNVRAWWDVPTLTFTAYDPFFLDAAENVAPCGQGFMAGGSATPHMEIRAQLASATQNPSWTDHLGNRISLSGSVGPGLVVIDLEAQTVTENGASIMSQYVWPESTFFPARLGYNRITGPGNVYWRERWE